MKKFRFEHLFLSLVSVVCATSVLASAVMTPYLSAQTTATGFSDVNGETPYQQSILYLQGRGIVGGLPDGTYAPYNFLTRSELLKIILRAKLGDVDDGLAGNCFADVTSDDWFAKYVCYAKQNGIVNGYNDGTFRPYQSVTYWEALKISLGVYGLLPVGDQSWSGILNHADELKVAIPSQGSNVLNRGQMAGLIAHIIAYTEQGPASPYLSPYPLVPNALSNNLTPIPCSDGTYSYAEDTRGACSHHEGIADNYYVDESEYPPSEYTGPTYSPPSEPVYTPPPASSSHTALCNDGTYSDAANHQGACSHHEGVRQWLDQ